MRIAYYIRRIIPRGGVKVLFQHVKLLQDRGLNADLFISRSRWEGMPGITPKFVQSLEDLGETPDVLVLTRPSDVLAAFRAGWHKRTRVCHLIQGDEIAIVESRLNSLWRGSSLADNPLLNLPKILHNGLRLAAYRRCYRLPTSKLAVSPHLCRMVERNLAQPCALVPNGIDLSIFKPAGVLRSGGCWNLLSVGPCHDQVKGIPLVLAAVRDLKDRGYPVRLTRVAGCPITKAEKRAGVVDDYLQGISEERMADVIRASDAVLIGSRVQEGFGLPALEAMACGVPCILTRIPAFVDFAGGTDFAHFVAPDSAGELAAGVIRLMTDGEYRQQIAGKGLAVAATFSLERVGESLAAYFLALAKFRHSPFSSGHDLPPMPGLQAGGGR